MSNIAIRVENLGKRYRRGADAPYHRFSELLQRIPSAAFGAARGMFQPNNKSAAIATADRRNEFWALKDVSFDVQEGEVLGVIGRNGAGKSTLLKILSRITEPTTGRFGVRGRLASLLEVGTGFHPELTGRENIYLSGTILGMSRAEIKRHFDEIVAFAEIEEALDTPVKRYSSGMYVRLGFAIAAHLQPEILIVDEVLAVGDAAFQKKCLGKMGDVAKSGRTVLFVSHNMAAVKGLCGAALLMENARMRHYGPVEDVIACYLDSDSLRASSTRVWSEKDAPGNETIRLLGVAVETASKSSIDLDSRFEVVWRFVCLEKKAFLGSTIEVTTSDGVVALHEGVRVTDEAKPESGIFEVRIAIGPRKLNVGSYGVNLIFGLKRTYPVYRIENVVQFQIESSDGQATTTSRSVLAPTQDICANRIADVGV